MTTATEAIDRLLAKCVEVDGCWVHQRPRDDGYCRATVNKEPQYGHRLSYRYFVGEIPEGLHIDHLCRNRACVNPWHMDPVTPAENNRRGTSPSALNAQKDRCPAGHDYDYVWRGTRQCLRCITERQRRIRSKPVQAGGLAGMGALRA